MKLRQKLIATILTVMMLTGHVATLTNAVIAAGVNIAGQNSKTNHANVEFNSYFEGETHSITYEIGKESKLYIKVKVNNTGYLKNGVVQFVDGNFEVESEKINNEKVQNSSASEIKLKQINNGNEVVVEVPVKIKAGEKVESNLFDKISTVKFTGTYIDGTGKEKKIEKEIKNEIKWKGTVEVEVRGEISKYVPYDNGKEKGVMVQAKITSGLKENSLPVGKTKIEVSIPEIKIEKTETVKTEETEGNKTEDKSVEEKTETKEETVKPTRVTVVANTTKGTNGKGTQEFSENNYKYNEETGRIEIEVTNHEEEGKISWEKKAEDEYLVNYVYTGEEVYNEVVKQLEKAKESIKTEEEKKAGQTNENAITGEIEVRAEIEAINSEETKVEKAGKIVYSIEKVTGEIVDSKVEAAEKVSKGYIYANYAKKEKEAKKESVEEKKETTYEINYTAQVQDKELVEGIEIEDKGSSYVDANGEKHSSKVGNKENIYSKEVKMTEANFKKMLGEEGKVEILVKGEEGKEDKKIGEITKDSNKDGQGNYVVDISESKVNEIVIRTSKVGAEGNVTVTVEKAIAGEQSYSREDMEKFQGIEEEVVIANKAKTISTKLTEPVSKAEVSIGTKTLSTVVENKDVEIRAVLDTSNVENALYKNPVLQIALPENIEKLDVNSVDLLLEDELKIKETKVVEQDGKKVIQITLEGTQTKYMDNGIAEKANQENVIAKGANIVIRANITFKHLAPSANTNILLYYTNQNTNLFENYYNKTQKAKARLMSATQAVGLASTGIEIVSPNGLVTENRMNGYKGNDSVNSITSDPQVKIIDVYGTAKEVNIGGTIVNNNASNLENVFILGRTPHSGNKQIDSTQELGSNFTMPMKSKITTSGIDSSKIKIYYSTNSEATKDLIGEGNGWTETPSNMADVKSYLIVIASEMAPGAQLKFDYKVELPGNLKYDNSVYSTYKVYYDNKLQGATIGETKIAGTIGLTTGEGSNLEVKLTSDIGQNAEVREGQIVRYHLEVKNSGKTAAQNAVANISVPDGSKLTSYSSYTSTYTDTDNTKINLGTIGAGETISKDFELRMLDLGGSIEIVDPDEIAKLEEELEKQETQNGERENITSEDITTQVRITTKDISNGVPSNTYTVKKTEGKMTILNIVNKDRSVILYDGNKLRNSIYVSSREDLKNVVLTANIPAGIKVNEAYYYDENVQKKTDNIEINNNVVKVTFPSVEAGKNYKVTIELEIDSIKESFSYMVTGTANDTPVHYSNSVSYQVGVPSLEITQNSKNSRYIKEAETVTYEFAIKNNGNSDAANVVFKDKIPDGLTFEKLEYTYNGQTKNITSTLNNTVEFELPTLAKGSTCNVKLVAKANLLEEQKEKEVKNSATIEAQGVEQKQSNVITNIIEYNSKIYEGNGGNSGNEGNPGTPGNSGVPGSSTNSRYKIAGTAWLDENQDGKRDESEQLLSNIPVMLINKSTSKPVEDPDTHEKKMTTTNSEGKYEFNNLPVDEYLVVFLYDAGKYSTTKYKEKSVGESYNSDAMSMRVTLDGEQRYAGVTDTIKLSNGHARDIDLGLYVAEKFDLRLDKYISKVTLTTPTNGTTVKEYNDSKLIKKDVLKQNVNKSSIIAEYKIVVTNEGQIAGYAKKIIDYLPDDVRFNSELNKDWYISDNNGTVYNTSLENEKIEPGQSKEVKLILSFNITDKNIGTIVNNNAEIYESYNEQGVEDYDSTEANRLESEDDMSSADIMLSIVTGKIVIYTTLGLAIMFLLGMGIIAIKYKVIDKKK